MSFMECTILTNETSCLPTADIVSSTFQPVLASGEKTLSEGNNESQTKSAFLTTKQIWRVEDCVGLELTMVPEVECVFVEKEEPSTFTVYTVVNERDLDVRSRIYDREMAILSAHPGIGIEFNVLSRRNRPLEAVIRTKEKPYKRAAVAVE